jgi:hypothetical protein
MRVAVKSRANPQEVDETGYCSISGGRRSGRGVQERHQVFLAQQGTDGVTESRSGGGKGCVCEREERIEGDKQQRPNVGRN